MRVTEHKFAMSALILRQGPFLVMMSALVALLPTSVALDAQAFSHGDSVTLPRDHHHATRGGAPSHNVLVCSHHRQHSERHHGPTRAPTCAMQQHWRGAARHCTAVCRSDGRCEMRVLSVLHGFFSLTDPKTQEALPYPPQSLWNRLPLCPVPPVMAVCHD
jgi:hypothetical protein